MNLVFRITVNLRSENEFLRHSHVAPGHVNPSQNDNPQGFPFGQYYARNEVLDRHFPNVIEYQLLAI